jgi:signal transduction histidine kinase
MAITYLSTKNYHEASTQLLNKDVAAHIAKFTSPFEGDGINKRKADSVFHDAMVISPSAEIYFLDTTGKIIAYHPNENKVQLEVLPLENIRQLIASHGQEYIKGPDPRDPASPKIFSAATVKSASKNLGFIYVILGSNKNVTNVLYSSYFSSLLIKVFCVIIIFSIILSWLYLRNVQQRFNRMIAVLERFQNGDLEARFSDTEDKQLAPVTQAFNKMADLLVYNINKLTKSEKERKDFVANISHDLRTPLSIARGYTETLLMKNGQQLTGDKQEEFLQLVHRKIRQVEHMVKQLFDLSRMEAAEFVPRKEPFVFSEVLLEIIHASSARASEKNITVDCSRCDSTSWIFADVGMMERVLQNLVINAIKHTPKDGLVKISLVKEDIELVFEIENSGANLKREILEWFNAPEDAGVAESRPGTTGIGLMIVRKILLLHQYHFKAEAIEGAGNKFTIVMPVLQNEA